jgi:RNA polymerase sigma-70 factor (family 1)
VNIQDYKKLSDNELISLLKEADHAAYEEIYSRYYYLMFVFAFKKLRDEDHAKDVVQDLFTNLWFKREQVLPTSNLAPFLYTSVRNQIINYFIHKGVQSRYMLSIKEYASDRYNPNTDHLIREKELQTYIDKEIMALPRKMRNVFELSKKGNLSNREIAQQLNTTENNVSQHVNNAIRILRVKLSSFFTILFL